MNTESIFRTAGLIGAALACWACGSAAPGDVAEPAETPPLPQETERPGFCARSGDDAVRAAFCGAEIASPGGLVPLLALLKLEPTPRAIGMEGPDKSYPLAGLRDRVYAVALAHSTALSGHLVSPINPRAIMYGNNTAVAYQRGVQRIEIVSRAHDTGTFNFYLLEFSQACNDSKQGCSPGDLYTPRVETGWLRVRVRDDEELKNTVTDCRQCHQRARSSPGLLMRELEAPWTHFFQTIVEPPPTRMPPDVRGPDLVRDYLAAKGDETYAGMPAWGLTHTAGVLLQGLAGAPQPLLFDAPRIEAERWPEGPDGWATQPQVSPTWENAYAEFKRGEHLALPYVEPRATDPAKQAQLTAAYASYRAGELEAEELPDLADIFPDDPTLRARIGLQTEPNATPAEALIQACGSCHNDVLDQTISRARFNIDVARLDRRALDLAIARIELPRTAAGAMPPPEARQLDTATRARLIAHLRADPAALVDPSLERAAALGMVGSALP